VYARELLNAIEQPAWRSARQRPAGRPTKRRNWEFKAAQSAWVEAEEKVAGAEYAGGAGANCRWPIVWCVRACGCWAETVGPMTSGFGGLDHVLGSGRNVNVLVLDTEVYSNTGGQMSKATPRGAGGEIRDGRKSAPRRKTWRWKRSATVYVYVARVALGSSDTHTVKAFTEAEAHRRDPRSSSRTATACARLRHVHGIGPAEEGGAFRVTGR